MLDKYEYVWGCRIWCLLIIVYWGFFLNKGCNNILFKFVIVININILEIFCDVFCGVYF